MACWRRPRWWSGRGRGSSACWRSPITTPPRARRSPRGLRCGRHAISCPASSCRRDGAAKLFTSSGWKSTRGTPGLDSAHVAGCSRAASRACREIGERLEKRARLPGRELAAAAAGAPAPTRLHLARLLVERGFARDTQEAFDRWLNRNTPGHVPAEWPTSMSRHGGAARQRRHRRCWRIRTAIASPPGNCASSPRHSRRHGGAALEASMAGMSPNDADRIAVVMPPLQVARVHGIGFPRSGRAVESPRPLA